MKEYKYKINGTEYTVAINKIDDKEAELEVNGTPFNVEILTEKKKKAAAPTIKRPQPAQPVEKVTKPAASSSKGAIKAPLPGVIIDVVVNVGDQVKRGQKLLVLEAMKMENNINSDKDGTVVDIKVRKGDSILEGTDLVVIE